MNEKKKKPKINNNNTEPSTTNNMKKSKYSEPEVDAGRMIVYQARAGFAVSWLYLVVIFLLVISALARNTETSEYDSVRTMIWWMFGVAMVINFVELENLIPKWFAYWIQKVPTVVNIFTYVYVLLLFKDIFLAPNAPLMSPDILMSALLNFYCLTLVLMLFGQRTSISCLVFYTVAPFIKSPSKEFLAGMSAGNNH